MSVFLIALFAAAGAGGWVYSKMQRRTGGLTQTSLLFASIAGVLAFMLLLIIFSFLSE